jgi:chorismate synthase
MSSQMGVLFRVTTFGESHGGAVGCVVDGCPAGISLPLDAIHRFLKRRKPGQSEFTTPRAEADEPEILSGVENGLTLGTPVTIIVRNTDKRPGDYSDMSHVFRPSHADYTTLAKFGTRPSSGGGRSSARETIGRVAAAAVAKCFLETVLPDLQVLSWVERIKDIEAEISPAEVTFEAIERSLIRCPDAQAEVQMKKLILDAKTKGDTVGGLIRCYVTGLPAGLGEGVFDKLEADLAKSMLSLPATKSFEIGSGVSGTFLFGSEHNDVFDLDETGKVITRSNKSGGIQGGISNGMPLDFSVGFKPVSTLFLEQDSVDDQGNKVVLKPKAGRHDSCVLPRAVPMVDAMTYLVLADHYLRQCALTKTLNI